MADGIILFRPDQLDAGEPTVDTDLAEIQRLEAEIEAKRERVVASFSELRRRVEGATDWRGWVRAHPVAWIAGAAAFGFIVGSLGSRGDSSSSR
jgi:ElaB/YqjD/DUF883 family membrane-anchored ribosome-binding protein